MTLSMPRARDELVAAARLLHQRGLTHGSTGNISIRVGDQIIVTPTGRSLGALEPEDLAIIDLDGNTVSDVQPSKEAFLHAAMYRARPEAGAVVHTHSTYSAAVACLAELDPEDALPPLTAYYAMRVGRLPLVDYFPPGDLALADEAERLAHHSPSLLLRNHGPLVVRADLRSAVEAAEELEQTAKLFLVLGDRKTRPLTEAQRMRLHQPAHSQEGTPVETTPSLTLFSGLAVKDPLEESLLPAFTEAHGIEVTTTFEPTSVLLDMINNGAVPDAIIGVADVMATLAGDEEADPATLRPIVRSSIGIAVPPDAPAPALSTVEELVDVLTGARAVAYSRSGASGIRFAALLDELGIREAVDERAVVLAKGFTAEALIDGRADVAVQQISELLSVEGARIVGPLPAEAESYIELSGVVGARSGQPRAAAQLVDFLASPAAAPAYEKIGMEAVVSEPSA